MMEDYIEVNFGGRQTRLSFEGPDSGNIRRLIVLPHEIQIVYLERDADGKLRLRDGDIPEAVTIHPW